MGFRATNEHYITVIMVYKTFCPLLLRKSVDMETMTFQLKPRPCKTVTSARNQKFNRRSCRDVIQNAC